MELNKALRKNNRYRKTGEGARKSNLFECSTELAVASAQLYKERTLG